MRSDECRSSEENGKQNTGHKLEVQNEDLFRKMSEDFDISQEKDWFSFPVNKTSHKTSIFSPELTLT